MGSVHKYTKGPSVASVQAGLGYRPQRPVSADSPVVYNGSDGTLTNGTNTVGPSELEDTAVTPGTYGDATNVGQFQVDQQGRLVDAGDVPIAFPASAVPSVTFGTGAPGGTPATGDLYFDDTGSPYVGYVGRAGVWHQF